MTLSRAERETIITRAADQTSWHVFTEDPSVIRLLTRRWGPGKPSGEFGVEWDAPKARISFRSPRAAQVSQRSVENLTRKPSGSEASRKPTPLGISSEETGNHG